MSIAELKAEVDRRSDGERKQLRTYLALKDQVSEADLLRSLTEKINDRRPDGWLSIEEFEKQVEG